MSEYQYVAYEPIDDGQIVRVMLNRPEARNAQNRGMLVELNEALLRAEADDDDRRRAAGSLRSGSSVITGDPNDCAVVVAIRPMSRRNHDHNCTTVGSVQRACASLSYLMEPRSSLPNWKTAPAIVTSVKDKVRADQ
jgi:hypothetical protein